MLARGRAKRLAIFIQEAARWHGKPLWEAILELIHAKGLAGATVVRALAGFTRGEGIATTHLVDLSASLPLTIEVVDAEDAIERVLPDIYLMVDQGLVTLEDVHVMKHAGAAEPPPAAAEPATRKVTMKAKQLAVHISEKDTYLGEPLHEAILKRFAVEELAGATVYRALEGFGAHHHIHRDRILTLHREAPVVIVVVDTEANIARARAVLDGMLKHGAVIVSDVEATFYGPSAEGKPG